MSNSKQLMNFMDQSLIYINYQDFSIVDNYLLHTANELQITKIREFDLAEGEVHFKTKEPEGLEEKDLFNFLKTVEEDVEYYSNRFIVLKDIHSYFQPPQQDPKVITRLKRIAQKIEKEKLKRADYYTTVFLVSSKREIPMELKKYITMFNLRTPKSDEIIQIVLKFAKSRRLNIDNVLLDRLALTCRGLDEMQIDRILNRAYRANKGINEDVISYVNQEKGQIIQKTGVLELVPVDKNKEIGGLDQLKEWLRRKATIFNEPQKIEKKGIHLPSPKGVLIVGVPGCGKSETAKVTANLLNVPLLKFDFGSLLGKYVGDSEENMRQALLMAENTSPCVLWIDEVEKGFSGVGEGGSGHEVTVRLFGYFLTWMQENKGNVFIVATANDISKLPNEFLRKGRFDDIFFIDFFNRIEREEIFKIHMKDNRHLMKDVDIQELAKKTEGFTGADINNVIQEVIEDAYYYKKSRVLTNDFIEMIERFPSFSEIMKDKVEKMRTQIKELGVKQANSLLSDKNTFGKVTELYTHTHPSYSSVIHAIIYSKNNNYLALAVGSGNIHVLDSNSNKEQFQLLSDECDVRTIDISKNGKWLVSAGTSKEATVWNLQTKKTTRVLAGHKDYINSVSVSSDTRYIATGCDDHQVRIFNLNDGKIIQTFKEHTDSVLTVAFSPINKLVASAGEDQIIYVWDVDSGKTKYTLRSHSNYIRALAFSPDGKSLVSCGRDHTVKVWDIKKEKTKYTFKKHTSQVYDVTFSADGEAIISAGKDGMINIWDTKTNALVHSIKHDHAITCLSISSDGKRLAIGDAEKQVKAWKIEKNN